MQPRTLTIGLIFLIMTLTTTAQEALKKAPVRKNPVPVPALHRSAGEGRAEASVEKILNIDFRGGFLEELLQTIEEQNGLTVNVIASVEARAQQIPSLKLRNVQIGALMMALENLGEFKVISGSPNIYTVITSSKPLRTSSRQSQSQMPFVTIHNIRSLVAGENNKLLFSVDDIVTAVSIGWEMVPGGKSAPSLKFHEETKLLIVRGNRDELRIAEDVLDKLNESQRRELQKEEADKNNQLKIQLEMLRKQVKDLQGINKMLQAKLDDKTHKEINK
jgi:hypothetical protein